MGPRIGERVSTGVKQLSDILLEQGLITEPELVAAFDEHQRAGRPLGRVLVENGVLTESQLVASLAHQIGLDFVDLSEHAVDVKDGDAGIRFNFPGFARFRPISNTSSGALRLAYLPSCWM